MKRCLISLVVIGLVFIIIGPVHALTYTYTTIDPAGSTWTVIRGINNSGHMSGNYNDGTYHNFYYDGSSYNDLADPNINFTWGISENDYIAGRYDDASGGHAFMYNGSGYTIIDYPGATFTSAGDVNNSGAVAGRAQIGWEDGEGWGYLYDGVSAFTQLYYPDSGTTWTNANGINNAGHVVGGWWDSNWNEYGYFYDGAGYSPVIYPGSVGSRPRGINNIDEMVGRYVDSSGSTHGFYYDGSNYVSIDVPGATLTEAYDINDSGVIVGYYVDSGGTVHGFMATPVEPPFINLPQTGQTTSYYLGDDGDLKMGVSWPTTGNMGTGRFNDNGDGTVTDLLTGLIWTKNANNGPVNFYAARDAAASMTTGGHTDWRIPNMLELESLTHAGEADSSAWLNAQGFIGMQATAYWSNNAYAGQLGEGWTINLGTDKTSIWETWNDYTRYYWPVRSGGTGVNGAFPDPVYPANIRKTGTTTSLTSGDDGDLEWGVVWELTTRFVDNLDGTITDDLTGLMWTQNGGESSIADGVVLSYQAAQQFIDDMNSQANGRCSKPPTTQDCSDFPIPRTTATEPCTDPLLTECIYIENGDIEQCRSTGDVSCIADADCDTASGETCVFIPNAGFTDWRLPNKKEMVSLTHWEDEFSSRGDLVIAGFSLPEFGTSGHWTSTTDPSDISKVFAVTLGVGGNRMVTAPTVSSGTGTDPRFLWPVRAGTSMVCSNFPAIIESQSYQSNLIQDAYDAANGEAVIKSHAVVFDEDLNINIGKSVYLRAGYDCDYNDPPAGITVLSGNMTISNGTFTVESGTFEVL